MSRKRKKSGVAFEAKSREGKPLFMGCCSTNHQARNLANVAAVREVVLRAKDIGFIRIIVLAGNIKIASRNGRNKGKVKP